MTLNELHHSRSFFHGNGLKMQQKLPPGEWLVIVVFIALMALLTAVTFFFDRHPSSSLQLDSPHHLVPQDIDVFIEGAVEHPGAYKIKRGSKIQSLLDLSKPLPEANLNKVKPQMKLKNGQRVHIPTKKMITIFLSGAVTNPGPYTVPKGTKWIDLLKIVSFSLEADLKSIKKKKLLQDQDVVFVKSLN